jgi:hypothetical protein
MLPIIFAFAAACALRPARCSCFPPPEPNTSAEARAYIDRAEEVFVGRVVGVDDPLQHPDRRPAKEDAWDVAVTLVVTSRWRGVRADTVVVHTSALAEMCGMEFDLGADYFVLASRYQGGPAPKTTRLGVWTCGQSRPAARADNLITLLGPPARR